MNIEYNSAKVQSVSRCLHSLGVNIILGIEYLLLTLELINLTINDSPINLINLFYSQVLFCDAFTQNNKIHLILGNVSFLLYAIKYAHTQLAAVNEPVLGASLGESTYRCEQAILTLMLELTCSTAEMISAA